jgi:hypothetical protein
MASRKSSDPADIKDFLWGGVFLPVAILSVVAICAYLVSWLMHLHNGG